MLKPGGALCFSDVFADRRISEHLAVDPLLRGECIGGAMYIGDFRRIRKRSGFVDFRCQSGRALDLDNKATVERWVLQASPSGRSEPLSWRMSAGTTDRLPSTTEASRGIRISLTSTSASLFYRPTAFGLRQYGVHAVKNTLCFGVWGDRGPLDALRDLWRPAHTSFLPVLTTQRWPPTPVQNTRGASLSLPVPCRRVDPNILIAALIQSVFLPETAAQIYRSRHFRRRRKGKKRLAFLHPGIVVH